ncbi:hypothetical protein DL767_002156 [Monosporascus sp. MG133]|nr:hypothetical protein DL767_002156 [Monosporascus sp. MG133]
MMESLSITTDCIALGNEIARASLLLNAFVRDVREARADVDEISRELHSLQSVLDLLKEDTDVLPPQLAAETRSILERCSTVVEELDDCISTLNSNDMPRQDKRRLWIAQGRKDSSRFKPTLEAHRTIIGLALDLIEATKIRGEAPDTDASTAVVAQRQALDANIIEDVSRILMEMSSLRVKFAKEFKTKRSEYTLQDYVNSLINYAEAVMDGTEEGDFIEQGAFVGEPQLFGAYVGDSPDDAIGFYDEPVLKTLKHALARNAQSEVHRISDISEEPADMDIPSRAPTPPPKDLKRLQLHRRSMILPFEVAMGSPTDSQYGVRTEISSPSQASISPSSQKDSRFSRFLGSLRKNSNGRTEARPQTGTTELTEAPSSPGSADLRPATSGDIRPSTPILQASLVRRGSRRLSVSFKKLPLWNDLDELIGPETDTVFGVSLQKSIQVARGVAKTHHSGGGRASRREYPLCVQRCCLYIKNEGITAPDIFAEPGDSFRVQKLREIFNRPPSYGEEVNWDHYGVYDAADLILLYLSQLPKPLVPESTAKRWVVLSRQATVTGSHGTRSEQCIDFWEEALGTIRGPARTVFKLLINLWADVAAAAEQNDMTAERLAGVLLKPLMHISSEKYETDFVLALAFLIRKRTEYVDMLKEDQKETRWIQKEAKRISKVNKAGKTAGRVIS